MGPSGFAGLEQLHVKSNKECSQHLDSTVPHIAGNEKLGRV